MPALISEDLGATLDNVELIRDQLAAILKIEFAQQATITGKPQPRVFLERTNPWGMFAEAGGSAPPIVNVWFESLNYEGSASNVVERQKAEAIYNIDVLGYGVSVSKDDGHAPGDQVASLACQRALRLVRRIIMSAHYTYLGLPRGTVWRRFPQSIQMFQPEMDNRAVANVAGGRLSLSVAFNEFSPQISGETLETLSLEVYRAPTGELLMRAQYPQE